MKKRNYIIKNVACIVAVALCWVFSPFIETRNPIVFHYLMGACGMFYLMTFKLWWLKPKKLNGELRKWK